MFKRNIFKLATQLNVKSVNYAVQSLVRCQSTTSKDLVLIDVNNQTGIATLTMNSLPVNSLNLELLTAFSKGLDVIGSNNSRGMILTSASKTVFSAGIDINEMHNPEYQRMHAFWMSLQEVWIKLYGSSFPTAAAVNGHAPAGGCFLAMCCEYRVMLPKYTIGLNETKLGIAAPPWFMATMNNCIPPREAEKALTLGTLFKTDEALRIGLIDEIAVDKADAIMKCETFLKRFENVSPLARSMTKQALRGKEIQKLADHREADFKLFESVITDKKVQKSLNLFVNILKIRRVLKSLTKPFVSIMKMFRGKPKIKKSKKYSDGQHLFAILSFIDVRMLDFSTLIERFFRSWRHSIKRIPRNYLI